MGGHLNVAPHKRFSNAYVIEFVGPAGAGKSSLTRTMAEANCRARPSNPPDFHAPAMLPFFILNILQTTPHLLRFIQTTEPGPNYASQLASIVILNGWRRRLGKSYTPAGDIVLLDQGPVYLLTDLFEMNPAYARHPAIQTWQADLYQRWACAIDLVVWLDAPDDILTERIRSRQKQHIMKSETDRGVHEFLALCREALDQTLLKLSRINRSLKILEFDTAQLSPCLIANQVFACLGLIEEAC